MTRVTHEHLVQAAQRLPIVELRFDHRADFRRTRPCRGCIEQLGRIFGVVSNQHTGEPLRQRIQAHDDLALQVFGQVRDEAVLAQCDHDIAGFEEKAVEVAAIDSR